MKANKSSSASLVVVGSGIKFLAHLTNEAKSYIEQSDKVLYLVNDPAMKMWIQEHNINAESLDHLYTQHSLRSKCYDAIAEHILTALRKNQHVCVVLYGHPSVFSQPGLTAIKRAKNEGYYAKILPGISAEDCLFADLLIDPGQVGCQSFEATDFLIYQREFDLSSHLILWQVDAIGILDNAPDHDSAHGIKLLVEYLQRKGYKHNHTVIIYEAAQYPGFEPRAELTPLEKLTKASFTRISTLYVPPAHAKSCSKTVLHELKIDASHQDNS